MTIYYIKLFLSTIFFNFLKKFFLIYFKEKKRSILPLLFLLIFYFNSSSISSILGNVPLKLSGKSLDSWYSDIPIGSLELSDAYFASILSFVLQINKPIIYILFQQMQNQFLVLIKIFEYYPLTHLLILFHYILLL